MANGLTKTAFENGATESIKVKPGETIRLRFVKK